MPRRFSAQLRVLAHPLAAVQLTLLRRAETPAPLFRQALAELSALLFVEMSRDLKTRRIKIKTPLQPATGRELADRLVLAPVLRAGLGMVDGILPRVPDAAVGYIGLFRDEKSLQPQSYYAKLPPLTGKDTVVFVLDPMLATGGSAAAAVKLVREHGARRIVYGCVISCPEGIRRLAKEHPDVPIYTAAVDARLNSKGYILPGLGDAGDRQFGT
jgi:uracil phosphoribosyltransferase